MKVLHALALAAVLTSGIAGAAPLSPIIGAWRLVEIDETQPGGKVLRHTDLKGSLIYTADGRLSVQVAYPDASVNTAYVRNGYEASFGRYTVEPRTHRLVHHVEEANVPALIGKDLPRIYRLEGRRLIIGPVLPKEQWSVIWERQ